MAASLEKAEGTRRSRPQPRGRSGRGPAFGSTAHRSGAPNRAGCRWGSAGILLASVLVSFGLVAASAREAAGQAGPVGGWTTGLTHSVAAGNNRVLVFFAGNENGKADTTLAAPQRDIIAVDYGGQSLTQAAEAVICTKSAANEWFCGRNEIWYLGEVGISAATGNSFSLTWADADTLEFDESYAAVTLANVDQVSPLRATGTNATTTVDPLLISSAMGVAAGDFVVVGAFGGNAVSYTPVGAYTESTDQQSTPVVSSTMATAFKAITAVGSEQPGMDFDGTINRQLITAAAFKDVPFGVGVAPTSVQADRLPSNGTTRTVAFTVTNTGSGFDDFDLLTSTAPGTVITVISITGPGITQGVDPDSARITGLSHAGSVVATVTYSIAAAATGTVDTLFLSARSAASPAEVDSGRLEVTVVRPDLAIGKSVDPVGSRFPGTDLTYTVTVTNSGTEDAMSVVTVDSLAAEIEFRVGSVSNTLPAGVNVTVEYSDDAGGTWSYAPSSGACGATAGYDRCVNRMRWTFQNNLSSATGDNVAKFEYVARIR